MNKFSFSNFEEDNFGFAYRNSIQLWLLFIGNFLYQFLPINESQEKIAIIPE
jgi:hypothetical protein